MTTVLLVCQLQRNDVVAIASFESKDNTLGFKAFDVDSIIMLIGDLDDRGPNAYRKSQLLHKIGVAKTSGVDTVLLCLRTSSVEGTFAELDSILEYATRMGLGVIPRIIVSSKNFTELLATGGVTDNILPDYANQTQLELGLALLRKVILHLEEIPNIIAYQIEWGHYGESWIDSPFWNSVSSNSSFINYLRSISPSFQNINEQNYADWVTGDIMYYSQHLPIGDPRTSQKNVALFYWYQEWRNSITLNITWAFRALAKQLTEKPIIGFSYIGTNTVSYVYNAQKYVDAAYSDAAASVKYTPNKNFVRDAYFQGLHLGELDFDSPYFSFTNAEEAIVGLYRKGIVPVIFFPQWSSGLKDPNIPILVSHMKHYNVLCKNPIESEILLVLGRNDIGFWSFTRVEPFPGQGPCISIDPPGLMGILEKRKLRYEIIDPQVYSPDIGNRYKIVVLFVPRDTLDCDFLKKLEQTNSYVVIMHPSFIVGTPTATNPTGTTSAIFGMWNPLSVKNRRISVAVTGTPPGVDITFSDRFSGLGGIQDYVANYLFSFYDGTFDRVYAMTEIGFPAVGRVGNLVFFGLDMHVENETQRSKVESFFIELLKSLSYPQSVGITDMSAGTAKTVVAQGCEIVFNTTIMNYGLDAETFDVTLYANARRVETLQASVGNGQAVNVTLEWKTSEMPLGAYEIEAVVGMLQNETDTSDNIFAYGTIHISIAGDINADGKVNILDVSIAATAYGTDPDNPKWNANADMNEDGEINILDISAIAKEYGKGVR